MNTKVIDPSHDERGFSSVRDKALKYYDSPLSLQNQGFDMNAFQNISLDEEHKNKLANSKFMMKPEMIHTISTPNSLTRSPRQQSYKTLKGEVNYFSIPVQI